MHMYMHTLTTVYTHVECRCTNVHAHACTCICQFANSRDCVLCIATCTCTVCTCTCIIPRQPYFVDILRFKYYSYKLWIISHTSQLQAKFVFEACRLVHLAVQCLDMYILTYQSWLSIKAKAPRWLYFLLIWDRFVWACTMEFSKDS